MTVPVGARLVTDPAELAEFYSDDRAAHVYALVDLEEPFWSPSRWYRRGDAVVGVVAMPEGQGGTVYAVSTRDPDGCLALLADLVDQLPSQLLITGPVGLGRSLRPRRDLAWDRPHVRYHLTKPARLPEPEGRIAALGSEHLEQLTALYASDPGAAFFRPHMLDDDSFVGVFEGGALVAAAGTHVLSDRQRCAAIGAVFTKRSHRGQGLGRAVAVGAVHRTLDRTDIVGLNVAADNVPARRIYEHIGFTPVLDYDEAELA